MSRSEQETEGGMNAKESYLVMIILLCLPIVLFSRKWSEKTQATRAQASIKKDKQNKNKYGT